MNHTSGNEPQSRRALMPAAGFAELCVSLQKFESNAIPRLTDGHYHPSKGLSRPPDLINQYLVCQLAALQ